MSRWKASSLHLGISTLVISTLALLLAATWYPPVYLRAVGGLRLMALLAGVDATLGPLLTLVVWNVRKPSLRFDMAVIVLLQLLGLGYGLHTIFLARPLYLVFAVDRFELVTAAKIPEGAPEQAQRAEFRSLPLTGPRIVAARGPSDADERNQLLFSVLAGGADLAQLPKYYLPYADLAGEAARKAQPLSRLMQRGAETRDRLLVALDRVGSDPSRAKFLPLRAPWHDQTVLIDGETGEVLGVVDVDPWDSPQGTKP